MQFINKNANSGQQTSSRIHARQNIKKSIDQHIRRQSYASSDYFQGQQINIH